MMLDAFHRVRARLSAHDPQRIDEPGSLPAAVALVLVPSVSGSDLDLLFIKRAEVAGDPWSGQMALPGGRRDPRDRDLLATAVRETREETGIFLDPSTLLGALDDYTPRTVRLPPVVVSPFVFGLEERPEVVLSPEATLHVWVGTDELRRTLAQRQVMARDELRVVSSFLAGGHIVWGLTERILTPFLELASDPQPRTPV